MYTRCALPPFRSFVCGPRPRTTPATHRHHLTTILQIRLRTEQESEVEARHAPHHASGAGEEDASGAFSASGESIDCLGGSRLEVARLGECPSGPGPERHGELGLLHWRREWMAGLHADSVTLASISRKSRKLHSRFSSMPNRSTKLNKLDLFFFGKTDTLYHIEPDAHERCADCAAPLSRGRCVPVRPGGRPALSPSRAPAGAGADPSEPRHVRIHLEQLVQKELHRRDAPAFRASQSLSVKVDL